MGQQEKVWNVGQQEEGESGGSKRITKILRIIYIVDDAKYDRLFVCFGFLTQADTLCALDVDCRVVCFWCW